MMNLKRWTVENSEQLPIYFYLRRLNQSVPNKNLVAVYPVCSADRNNSSDPHSCGAINSCRYFCSSCLPFALRRDLSFQEKLSKSLILRLVTSLMLSVSSSTKRDSELVLEVKAQSQFSQCGRRWLCWVTWLQPTALDEHLWDALPALKQQGGPKPVQRSGEMNNAWL